MNGQLSLFSAEELLDGQDLLEHNAKLHVLKVILRSCSNRQLIRGGIERGRCGRSEKVVR